MAMIGQYRVVPFIRTATGTLQAGEAHEMPDANAAKRLAEALMLVPGKVGVIVTCRALSLITGKTQEPSLLAKFGDVNLEGQLG